VAKRLRCVWSGCVGGWQRPRRHEQDPAHLVQCRRDGFDPVRVTDTYSNGVTEQIYEPLLTYDYLARRASWCR
jgi:hypothetical protein